MLNLNQLRVFYEVAKSLNYSAAADKLSVTQPAISKQIKALEEYYDLKLFTKKKQKIHITDEGRKILIYASRIFELERQLEEMIGGLKNLKYGSLRIATTQTYARRFFTTLVIPFQQKYPHVIIELDEGSSLNMARSLLNFKNSLAIVAEVQNEPDITFLPLLLEEVVLIAGPSCPLAAKGEVDFPDLKGYPLIMKEIGSGTRKLVDEKFHSHHVRPKIIAQSNNMGFIKNMVLQNNGISFVVRSAVEQELSQGDLISIPLKHHPLFLVISIAFLKDYALPNAAKTVLEYFLPLTRQKNLPVGMLDVIERLSQLSK